MIEIRLDQKVRTETRHADDLLPILVHCLTEHFPPETLLPLGSRSVRDRGNLYEREQGEPCVSGKARWTQDLDAYVERVSYRRGVARRHSKTLDSNWDPTSVLWTRYDTSANAHPRLDAIEGATRTHRSSVQTSSRPHLTRSSPSR